MHFFGTDGIRGHVGDFLTASLALEVGYCVAEALELGTSRVVVIGEDSRNSSPMLTAALTAGFNAAGLNVWQLGICPTPTVAYLCANSPEILAGVIVSASHNPPEDNGIKFFDQNGIKLSQAVQAKIEALIQRSISNQIRKQNPAQWGKSAQKSSLINRYQAALCDSLNSELSGLKIVLDLAWGAASLLAPQVFQQLGAEVICLHDRPDGDRINVNCGSTNLTTLGETVKQCGADIGIAFDGDADRALAVDENGQSINGDYILYLWGSELLGLDKLPDRAIVTTVMANLGFEKAWQKLGGKLVRTAVGDQYVHAEMLESGAMLGGEQSGHILCRHYGVSGDGILTAIHLAALVKQKAPLSQLVAESFTPFPQFLKNVRVESKQQRSQWQSCEVLTKEIERAISDLGDRGRVLVRASGTEPLMRVMVEAENLAAASHWTDRLVSTIEKYLLT
jgi:phosphoglucosamine mutase